MTNEGFFPGGISTDGMGFNPSQLLFSLMLKNHFLLPWEPLRFALSPLGPAPAAWTASWPPDVTVSPGTPLDVVSLGTRKPSFLPGALVPLREQFAFRAHSPPGPGACWHGAGRRCRKRRYLLCVQVGTEVAGLFGFSFLFAGHLSGVPPETSNSNSAPKNFHFPFSTFLNFLNFYFCLVFVPHLLLCDY